MRINIKATGSVVLTEELRSFVEEKIEKLGKLLDPKDTTILAEIELQSISESKTDDLFRAEINLSFTGRLVRAEARAETLHAAIDDAISEAKREVHGARSKRRNLVRRGAARVKGFFRRFER